MARTKKTEVKEVKPVEKEVKPVENFGTGWARVNNMLQAGKTMAEIREDKRNE